MRSALRILGGVAFVAFAGCESDETTGLAARDAGFVRDAGFMRDAGFIRDAGLVRDAGFMRDAGLLDAGVRDGGERAECVVAADCRGGLVPFTVPSCPNSDWSCLAGSCTWDCDRPGRTCNVILGPTGNCVECSDDPGNRVCPEAPCSTPDFTTAMIEHGGGCARLLSASILRCQGDFAWLDEFGLPDRLCAVAPLPTGAIRAVLSCSFCQQQYTW